MYTANKKIRQFAATSWKVEIMHIMQQTDKAMFSPCSDCSFLVSLYSIKRSFRTDFPAVNYLLRVCYFYIKPVLHDC